jgi:hypothetical protein
MVMNPLASRLLQDGLDMHRRGAVADAAARYSQILKFEPKYERRIRSRSAFRKAFLSHHGRPGAASACGMNCSC